MISKFSSALLVILIIIVLFVILNKISLNFNLLNLFDTGKLPFIDKFSIKEGFTSNAANLEKNKNTKQYFGDRLEVRKTNNFNRVFSNSKYTIWEPERIDNYLPIGHIVTKKNKQPKGYSVLVNDKQTVKPDKFNIISISNDNWGIWQPVSNDSNYVSLGNIYSKEYPSKYLVRMVNKKFLVESDLSKLIFENKINKTDKGYELWGIKGSDCFTCNNKNNVNEFDSLKNVFSLNKTLLDVEKKLYIKYTMSYKKITSYQDNKLNKYFSIWRPIPPINFCSLGDIILNKKVNPNNILETIVVHKSFCKPPVNYGISPIITFETKGGEYSIWKPKAPTNYQFIGNVTIKGKNEPETDDLISCIPIDYLELLKKETHTLVWNNINEENPKSLWMNYLNILVANNKYVPPSIDGVVLKRDLTTSDIDLLDNSKSLLLKFKKNNKNMQPINEVYLKNLIINTFSNKFDIDEDRIKVEKIDFNSMSITLTILPRKVDKNSITVDDTVNNIEKTISVNDIKIYNEDKSFYLITINDGGIIKEKLNEIKLDNTDYLLNLE
jgi:hypothetical protein